MHDLGTVHRQIPGRIPPPAAPPLRSVGPLHCPSPVGEIAADADRAAIDLSSGQRVQLSADCRHGGLVDQPRPSSTRPMRQGHSPAAWRGLGSPVSRAVRRSLVPVCLTECFLPIAGHAEREIGERNCLPSMRCTFVGGLLEQSPCPAAPSVPDGGFQALEMIKGKLQSHFGCVAFVALRQISGVRPLPCLDCRVGIPGKPCGLC